MRGMDENTKQLIHLLRHLRTVLKTERGASRHQIADMYLQLRREGGPVHRRTLQVVARVFHERGSLPSFFDFRSNG